MTLQYIITGGQLIFDKKAFAKELLLPQSPLSKLIRAEERADRVQPKITKAAENVIVNYNDASDIILEEDYFDLLSKLKQKYKGKLKGSIVIRIVALTTYHVTLDLNSEDEKVSYAH